MSDTSIKNKLDNLLLELVKRQDYDGAVIQYTNDWRDEDWTQFGIKDKDEGHFYMNVLAIKGYIKLNPTQWMVSSGGSTAVFQGTLSLTYDGIIYASAIQEGGEKSTKCFIAMSFDPIHKYLFADGFDPTCIANGFQAIRVDNLHGESTQTINVQNFPSPASFALALRMRFSKNENGDHTIANMALPVVVQFQNAGKYVVEVYFDNVKDTAIPLKVAALQPPMYAGITAMA